MKEIGRSQCERTMRWGTGNRWEQHSERGKCLSVWTPSLLAAAPSWPAAHAACSGWLMRIGPMGDHSAINARTRVQETKDSSRREVFCAHTYTVRTDTHCHDNPSCGQLDRHRTLSQMIATKQGAFGNGLDGRASPFSKHRGNTVCPASILRLVVESEVAASEVEVLDRVVTGAGGFDACFFAKQPLVPCSPPPDQQAMVSV
ncbi:hypothetical protein N658DRAFT_132370 [Parathielavia hyrcaniae]|uniref:Uncharacterized protein n=1 Tax=Parathielavia hyrcaniae TaxID=113614 RepID=A0AAN6QCK9_9PEZI|nr:hypothetical protein N658DRAFT_132370 [Parathielavia hyrcaniae]